ncbi:MAG: DMT family transporter [Candidatus Puniceispirillaceae bacterium]
MFEIAHLLALGAALSWTLSGLLGHAPVMALGSLHFNRIRMIIASLWLIPMVMLSDGQWQIAQPHILPIIASSLIGIVLGDYFLFVAMQRLGPRLTGVLFAANAPLAALLGWLFLSEALSLQLIMAILLGFSGICLAILFGKRRQTTHIWEQIKQPLWIGLCAGLLAAFGQAAGVLILRPVMAEGVNPWTASLLRVLIAALCLWATFPFDKKARQLPLLPARHISWSIIGNGFFGLSFGVALMLKALETGPVAEVSLLASVSPVMVLPFIWWQTKLVPPPGAWIGAALVVTSSYLLLP